MLRDIRKTIVCILITITVSGCAVVPESPWSGSEENSKALSKPTKTLLVLGGVLLVGAIVASQAENNIEDALRDTVRP